MTQIRKTIAQGRLAAVAAILTGLALFSQCGPVGLQAAESTAIRTVAITFDDLPHVNAADPDAPMPPTSDAVRQVNHDILAALKAHTAPATGFVVEKRVEQLGPLGKDMLRDWTNAGLDLGNHTYSHADSNGLDVNAIEKEIVDGERSIRPFLFRSATPKPWFLRFPYNHVGNTPEKQQAIAALAAKHGYTLAASTIDTSDYLFDRAYEKALVAKDAAKAERIVAAYLEHTKEQIAYYADLNRQVLGYEPPAIMLLHVNSLNAVTLDRILILFEEAGYRFTTLQMAQADPVYQKPLTVATKFGPMWGYRWARQYDIKVNGSAEKEPPDWVVKYGE
ncbi:MAG TPA: polysaccharide deacetylase family protein [Mesorhizobium sp.]|jgi:peptidoglycan/xylan/chitin deacetylase (PgdA/CDA1 family)|uniref:polysaccharide deacetylase family protein n=1 Tax=Mesorhizobium sp. TaxID=1871066 RepID=UPI002DDCC3B3|nr:polysaccharide deacetylase family protein [Mesorhizobium sp.]HEV2505536.1 polysaccharide deacetylase family protein [Mesorhizobium sp.]